MKKTNWIESAYKGTDVHWAKSQTKIMEMLASIGVNQTRFTNLEDRMVLEFVVRMDEVSVPKAVRIITMLSCKVTDDPVKRNKELNIIHRILLGHLKAKFIAVGRGLAEFETEFMGHLVVTDKNGNSTTMAEAILPQYKKNLEDGSMPQFLLSGSN
jgi:hypothetical protein